LHRLAVFAGRKVGSFSGKHHKKSKIQTGAGRDCCGCGQGVSETKMCLSCCFLKKITLPLEQYHHKSNAGMANFEMNFKTISA